MLIGYARGSTEDPVSSPQAGGEPPLIGQMPNVGIDSDFSRA